MQSKSQSFQDSGVLLEEAFYPIPARSWDVSAWIRFLYYVETKRCI
jgi:hypothetical protein